MTNIAATLEAQLDTLSLRQLRGIAAVAEIHGARTYLVGGAVRDALLGLRVTDIDIAVVGMTSGFPRGAAAALNGKVVAHSQFNTFALNASGRHIDLAMARHETYTHPGALPTVAPGTMQQDLARRDFAINAMAASINANSWGELLDPFNGQDDVNRSIVRVLYEDSFRDDATRIIRAARYTVRLGFTLHPQTEHLLSRDTSYLDTISGARLRHEFERVLQEGRAVSTLEMLHRLGALRSIHPSLALDPPTERALRLAEKSQHSDKPSIYLSILSHDMNAQERASFVDRLHLTSRWAQVIDDTGRAQAGVRDDLSVAGEPSRSEIYLRLRGLDEAAILGCALFAEGSREAQRLMLYLNDLRHMKPILNGNDLLGLGVTQGPPVGELLHDLLVARLDEQIETRQDEIDLIRTRL